MNTNISSNKTKKDFFQVDLVNGPILKSLLIFALPFFISTLFQQCYNLADTMIVGHLLGDDALGAVGAASPVYELLIGFAVGIGSGLTIITAKFFGQGDEEGFKKSVAASFIIAVITSAAITVLSYVLIRPLLILLKTPDKLLDDSYSYIMTIISFSIITIFYNLFSGILRSVGNSFMPLIFLIVATVSNVGLDFVFIGYFKMGVAGAALATVIAQSFSVLLCIIYILLFASYIIPKKDHFKTDRILYKELLSQGFAMAFMSAIVSAGTVILQSGINPLGKTIVAGHTTARKIFVFSIMPISSVSYATVTFVSQNFGADKRERIIKCVRGCYIYMTVMSLIIWMLMIFFARPLVKLVSGSSNEILISNATRFMICNPPFYIALGILLVTRLALQSMGAKILSVASSVIEMAGKIVFVILFIPMFKYNAVIFCEPVIWCVMALYLVIIFNRHPYIRGKTKLS